MMFFKFLNSFFGLLFALRIYKFELQNGILTKKFLQKWLVGALLVNILTLILFFGHGFAYWVSILVSIIVLLITIFVTKLNREKKFRDEFLNLLDRILLQVQSGKSFRVSLQLANQFTPEIFQIKINQIIEAIVFSKDLQTSQTQNQFVEEIFFELSLVDKFPHKCLQRLTAYRRKLKIESEFRHKSSQKQRQVKIQTVVLSFLYALTLAFVVFSFGFQENQRLIIVSFGLFLAGILVVLYLGRQNQWKL